MCSYINKRVTLIIKFPPPICINFCRLVDFLLNLRLKGFWNLQKLSQFQILILGPNEFGIIRPLVAMKDLNMPLRFGVMKKYQIRQPYTRDRMMHQHPFDDLIVQSVFKLKSDLIDQWCFLGYHWIWQISGLSFWFLNLHVLWTPYSSLLGNSEDRQPLSYQCLS